MKLLDFWKYACLEELELWFCGGDADGNDYILIFMKREYYLNNVIEIW